MFTRNNLLLLRIPFSFFLLPVFCFALVQAQTINIISTFLFFILLHFLVYPASNAYNSYMDQDEGSIGGLRNPPKADVQVFYLTIVLDGLACVLAFFIHWQMMLQVIIYILASKAYSYHGIRIKKYPIGSFLLVIVCQGSLTYFMAMQAIQNKTLFQVLHQNHFWGLVTAGLLVGAVYPLTQIYQHEEDARRRDRTLSLLLGKKGTFVFSALLFALGGLSMAMQFYQSGNLNQFFLLGPFLIPVLAFFSFWFYRTIQDPKQANFDNTMRMNTIASVCLVAGFCVLLYLK